MRVQQVLSACFLLNMSDIQAALDMQKAQFTELLKAHLTKELSPVLKKLASLEDRVGNVELWMGALKVSSGCPHQQAFAACRNRSTQHLQPCKSVCKLLASKQLAAQTVLSRPRDVKYSKVVDAVTRIASASGVQQGHSVLEKAEAKVGVSLSDQQRQDVAHFEDTLLQDRNLAGHPVRVFDKVLALSVLDELDILCKRQKLPEGMEAFGPVVQIVSKCMRAYLQGMTPDADQSQTSTFCDLGATFMHGDPS